LSPGGTIVRQMFAMVRGHWVENINWVRIASDLEIKTANAFAEKLKVN